MKPLSRRMVQIKKEQAQRQEYRENLEKMSPEEVQEVMVEAYQRTLVRLKDCKDPSVMRQVLLIQF